MPEPGGVARLEAVSGEAFPALRRARENTQRELDARRERLRTLDAPGVAVVLMGSFGRHELTGGSDDDFMVLFDPRPAPGGSDLTLSAIAALLGGRPPGQGEIFGKPVSLADLVERIGSDRDSNRNLTRRMLLVLESVCAYGPELHARARERLIDGYLAAGANDYRPPRFLLNDLVRYWRTIAVDFEGKLRARGGEGWGLRNAKLRLSRKALFAGGLLPVLECHSLTATEMLPYLTERMSVPPLDRIADAFVDHRMIDPGVRAVTAYDRFLSILDSDANRRELDALLHDDRHDSVLFQSLAALGEDFQAGLLTLLFEDPDLSRLTREYLIF